MDQSLRDAIKELSDQINWDKTNTHSPIERKRPVRIYCGCSFDGNQFYYSLYWKDGKNIWEGKSDLSPEGFADEFFECTDFEEIRASIIFIVNKTYIVKEIK